MRSVCFCCGAPIDACFGYVLARDLLPLLDGAQATYPRELCGRCGERVYLDPSMLARNDPGGPRLTDPAPTTNGADPPKKPDPMATLLPHKEVALLDGRRVIVKPWGILEGKLFLGRLQGLTEKVAAHPDADSDAIVDLFWDDLVSIARDTIGWSVADWNGITLEDGLAILLGVVNTSILRPDGGGVLGKMLTLRTMGRLLLGPVKIEPQPEPMAETAATH